MPKPANDQASSSVLLNRVRSLLRRANRQITGTLHTSAGAAAGVQITVSPDYSEVYSFILCEYVREEDGPHIVAVTPLQLQEILTLMSEFGY